MRLKNKVALITGGNSGIGYSTAQEFIVQGAKVIITGRDKVKLDESVKSLGNNAYGILSDASDIDDIKALPDKIKLIQPRLDILFLNAGSFHVSPFETTSEEAYDSIQFINSKGVYFTIQKLIALIPAGGSIIINSTIGVNTTRTGISSLLAAKGAIDTLSRALANELAEKDIRINTVSPGVINTPGVTKTVAMVLGVANPGKEQLEGFVQSIIPGIPMKRIGEAKEIAKAVLFLASDDSSYVTGADLKVDGGKSITW